MFIPYKFLYVNCIPVLFICCVLHMMCKFVVFYWCVDFTPSCFSSIFRQVRFCCLLCYYGSYFSIISSRKTNYRVSFTLTFNLAECIFSCLYIQHYYCVKVMALNYVNVFIALHTFDI